MRVFVLGTGAIGSVLAHLLTRQGHEVTCGDRDPDRARRFLGKRSKIPVQYANARSLWSIVKAARRSQLLVNCSPAVFNKTVLRATLRLRCHYLDTASHMMGHPFRVEQLRFASRFEQKRRLAVIDAGAAPGLTNLLAMRGTELLEATESVHIRLFESTTSDDPFSQWSPDAAFDEATSRPRVYRNGRFHLAKRFGEREVFRFPPPIGPVGVLLAAQDEVVTLPHVVRLREMDAKIGGNDFERLRRLYRQGKLRRSRGMDVKRFPKTLNPRQVARLIRLGILRNARFAAAVLVQGLKGEQRLAIRWDAGFPTLYQIRLHGMHCSPIAWATAHMAALFVKHWPRDLSGVYPPEALPAKTRQAILAGARPYRIRMTKRVTRLTPSDDEE